MSKKLSLCVVGCGRVFHSHMKGILEQKDIIDLISVVDIDEKKAKRAVKTYGVKKYYLSTVEAFDDPEIEAVDLCLPNDQHCPAAIEAANMGKHVLVEKPMANTVKEADRMIEAAAKNKVILMVGQSRRFYDTVMESKRLVDQGRLGKLFSIRANFLANIAEPLTSWWPSKKRTGGLVIPLWGSHLVDYVIWVKGKKPVRVYAETYSNNPYWEGEDEVSMLLGFNDGSMATIVISWNLRSEGTEGVQGKKGIWKTVDTKYDRCLFGSKGTLWLLDETKLILNGTLIMKSQQKLSNFALQLKEFVDSIRLKREPLTSGRKNRGVIQVLEASLKSAEQHSVIKIA